MEEKRVRMVQIAGSGQPAATTEMKELMAATYTNQREIINGFEMPMAELLEHYPPLFTESGMECHFSALVGIELSSMSSAMESQRSHLLNFMATLTSPAVREILGRIRQATEEAGCAEPEILGIILLLV